MKPFQELLEIGSALRGRESLSPEEIKKLGDALIRISMDVAEMHGRVLGMESVLREHEERDARLHAFHMEQLDKLGSST